MDKRYITLRQLRAKLGGRARNSIFADVTRGDLPPPFKLGHFNYWIEAEVDAALRELAEEARSALEADHAA